MQTPRRTREKIPLRLTTGRSGNSRKPILWPESLPARTFPRLGYCNNLTTTRDAQRGVYVDVFEKVPRNHDTETQLRTPVFSACRTSHCTTI